MKKTLTLLFAVFFLLIVTACKKEKDPFANYEGMKITNPNGDVFVLPTEKFAVTSVKHRLSLGDNKSYQEIELRFFNNKPVPEYKFVSVFIRADENGFDQGVYTGISTTDLNSVSSFWFADGSYSGGSTLTYTGAGKIEGFEITEINLSGGKKILKGKLKRAAFYNVFKVWGDDDIRDAEFRVEF